MAKVQNARSPASLLAGQWIALRYLHTHGFARQMPFAILNGSVQVNSVNCHFSMKTGQPPGRLSLLPNLPFYYS
ncbi:MAG TPA: hypothetical protein VGP68_02635, partial [Gemmataceae bacterium]|nr:hypothetical protein [Gemmataceae bacterium]